MSQPRQELEEAKELLLNLELERCKAELVAIEAEFDAMINAGTIDTEAARDAAKRMVAAVARLEAVTSALSAKPPLRAH